MYLHRSNIYTITPIQPVLDSYWLLLIRNNMWASHCVRIGYLSLMKHILRNSTCTLIVISAYLCVQFI